jgi:hypothetical protein
MPSPELKKLPAACAQSIIADPPYFNVLEDEAWDTQWKTAADYLAWCEAWVAESMRVLRDDGLCFIFGQLGKREHTFLHLMSRLTQQHQFHDLIIWDRAVGYNERRDSFTPQYEMILVLRKGDEVKFNKDAVRIPYDAATIRGLPQRQALQGQKRPPRPSRSRQVCHQHPSRAQLERELEGKVRPPLAKAHRPHRKAHRSAPPMPVTSFSIPSSAPAPPPPPRRSSSAGGSASKKTPTTSKSPVDA